MRKVMRVDWKKCLSRLKTKVGKREHLFGAVLGRVEVKGSLNRAVRCLRRIEYTPPIPKAHSKWRQFPRVWARHCR